MPTETINQGIVNALQAVRNWPNAGETLPANPPMGRAFFLTKDLRVDNPQAGAPYFASVRMPPDQPPAVVPIASAPSSFLDKEGVILNYADVNDLIAALNQAVGDSFTLDDGSGNALTATLGTVIYLFPFGPTTINSTSADAGECMAIDLANIGSLSVYDAPPSELAGPWVFGQADIDSGIIAAMFDVFIPMGGYYFDGDMWQPLPGGSAGGGGEDFSPQIKDLKTRIEALENAMGLSEGDAGAILNGE